MKKTINSLRGELMFLLEKYELLHEDIAPVAGNEGFTITFARKIDTQQFQRLIHYLNEENENYATWFCPKAKRIKVTVYVE